MNSIPLIYNAHHSCVANVANQECQCIEVKWERVHERGENLEIDQRIAVWCTTRFNQSNKRAITLHLKHHLTFSTELSLLKKKVNKQNFVLRHLCIIQLISIATTSRQSTIITPLMNLLWSMTNALIYKNQTKLHFTVRIIAIKKLKVKTFYLCVHSLIHIALQSKSERARRKTHIIYCQLKGLNFPTYDEMYHVWWLAT